MTGVPPGAHPNWCRCPGCRANIACFEARQWHGTLIAAAVIAALGCLCAGITLIAHAIHW
jgi:hypothetical protein